MRSLRWDGGLPGPYRRRAPAPDQPAAPARPARVLVVEARDADRRRTVELLTAAGLVVAAEANGLVAARHALAAHSADVALVDIRLPDGSGLELCRALRAADPALRVIVRTEHDDRVTRVAAAVAGASGYLVHPADGTALEVAVRDVAAGGSLLEAERAAARRLLGDGSIDHSALGPLTERERTVRVLLLRGHSDAAIAELLGVDERSVRADVALLLTKLLLAPPSRRARRVGASLTTYLARLHRPESAWM
ncbi:MAG: response regulator transcription factor [Jatrophihabitans sp.]|uniref:response regulator transcription factor n=1 Tax=Jatrophihabitans sp. TaxID=1932789 RepID=UPI003F7E17C8